MSHFDRARGKIEIAKGRSSQFQRLSLPIGGKRAVFQAETERPTAKPASTETRTRGLAEKTKCGEDIYKPHQTAPAWSERGLIDGLATRVA
jgi:hypothetical protein